MILLGLDSGTPGDHYREIFDVPARKYKTAYIPDILEGIWGHPEMMSDNLHPNDRGYALVAERIKPVLEDLLD